MARIPMKCSHCDVLYWCDINDPHKMHGCLNDPKPPTEPVIIQPKVNNLWDNLWLDHDRPTTYTPVYTTIPKEPKPPKKQKVLYDHKCTVCAQEFKTGHKHRVYCTESCRMKGLNKNKIDEANKKWLNPVPRKKSKYTFSQLNMMAEWKRVWDDESWTRRFNARRM